MAVLLLLLIVLAVTGVLWFVVKVAIGVALGIFLGLVAVAAVVTWRVRRALFGSRRRPGGGLGPRGPRGGSRITIIRPD